jgi:hypothetical protein
MQFTKSLRPGVRRGDIRWTVRIWTHRHVKVGGRYPMGDGHVVVERIEEIEIGDVSEQLARASGFDSVEELLKVAGHGKGQQVYAIRFHYEPGGAAELPAAHSRTGKRASRHQR